MSDSTPPVFAIVGTPTDGFSVWRLIYPTGGDPYYGRKVATCTDYVAASQVKRGLESQQVGPPL